jgi:small subunit ribosomal protein S20
LVLPVTESAKKRLRQSDKRRLRNRVYRSEARTYVKRTNQLIAEQKLDEAAEVAALAVSALDRAAQKGVVHKKNAARRKSRLIKRLHRAQAQSADQ